MARLTKRTIIKTSLVSAFTFAAALIWKDVLVEVIELIFPAREEIFFKFIAAVFATALAILAIYIILQTEEEAEDVIKKLKHKDKKKRRAVKRLEYLD